MQKTFVRFVFEALLGLVLSVLPTVSCALADSREISVKGSVEFKMDVDAGKATVRGGAWKSAVVEKKESTWIFHEAGGPAIATAAKSATGDIELKDGTGTKAFEIAVSGETLRIADAASKPVWRVKIKDDKFNIYDPSDKRLFHGKQKDDGWGVKDEKDEQVLKIKGTTTLRETALLSIPIQAQYRILVWAAENL